MDATGGQNDSRKHRISTHLYRDVPAKESPKPLTTREVRSSGGQRVFIIRLRPPAAAPVLGGGRPLYCRLATHSARSAVYSRLLCSGMPLRCSAWPSATRRRPPRLRRPPSSGAAAPAPAALAPHAPAGAPPHRRPAAAAVVPRPARACAKRPSRRPARAPARRPRRQDVRSSASRVGSRAPRRGSGLRVDCVLASCG